MIDKINTKKVNKIKMPKLHGHTTIELTNTKTGKVDKIESDNIVTDAIEKYLQPLGILQNSPFNNSGFTNYQFFVELIGGIFLFDSAIDENGIFPQTGAKMIGNGARSYSGAGQVTEFGTHNTTESYKTDNSIVQVYDFGTDQANGTIKSVCLTSRTGGYIGYGNASGRTMSTSLSMMNNQQVTKLSTSNDYRAKFIIKGNKWYSLKKQYDTNNTKLDIATRHIPITEISLFDGANVLQSYSVLQPAITLTTAMPTAYQTTMIGDKFVLIPLSATYNNNASILIYIVDPITNRVTEKRFTNKTGETIRCNEAIMVRDNEIIVRSKATATKYFVIDVDTSTVEQTINIPNEASRLFLLSNGWVLTVPSSNSIKSSMIDVENGTAYLTNTSQNTSVSLNYQNANFNYSTDDDLEYMLHEYYGSTGNINYVEAFKNPLYLATINNLETPITKTAEQTMKITYTVTLTDVEVLTTSTGIEE